MLTATLNTCRPETPCYQGFLAYPPPHKSIDTLRTQSATFLPLGKAGKNNQHVLHSGREMVFPPLHTLIRRIGTINPVIFFSNRAILPWNRSLNTSNRGIPTEQRRIFASNRRILPENRAILRRNRSLNTLPRAIGTANRELRQSSGGFSLPIGRFSLPIGGFQHTFGMWNSAAEDFLFQSEDFTLKSFAGHFYAKGSNSPADRFCLKFMFYSGKTALIHKMSNHNHYKYLN